MIGHGVKPGDRASHLTSLPYQMAVAALQPEAALDVAQPAATEAMASFMSRIEVAADEALLADYPAAWPARIVVTTPSDRHERLVRHVPGDAARPFTKVDVFEKFDRLIGPIMGEAGAKELRENAFAMLQSADKMMSVTRALDRATAQTGAT